MAKARSWRGPDPRQSNYSEDFLRCVDHGDNFVSEFEKTARNFDSNFIRSRPYFIKLFVATT